MDYSDIPLTGSVKLPPAPRSLEALGRNHELEEALAELVDNSIDAGARQILVRFVRRGASLQRLVVVDDGSGMDEITIDIAMTLGGEREYEGHEIGRFGAGLKAASFSQADTLTVFTRSAAAPAAGRRWKLSEATADFSCQIIDAAFSARQLDSEWELPPSSTGTLVCWDDVRGFPQAVSEEETDKFLQSAFSKIRTHLGLIYHRLIESGRVRIYIDMEDVDEGLGQRIEVSPIDPFAYPRSGSPAWPKLLEVPELDLPLTLDCHVWPGRSSLEPFRLDGDLLARQGLYVYLNDRIVQRGGWNGLVHPDRQLNVARIRVDINGDIAGFLAVKPEKNGIEPGPRFGRLIGDAKASDDATFDTFLAAARDATITSNRRQSVRASRLPAGQGFDPMVRRVIEREIPLKDEEPVSIRWCPMDGDEFLVVDREDSVLWLNKRYRAALLGKRAGSLNDLPMVKTLLYLLYEEIFTGQNVGPRDRDNLELWAELLKTAAKAEGA